jgi:hypothetical protein
MDVVELGDGGVPRLQHLHEQLGREQLQILGRDATGEGVHGLTPGPEAVVCGEPEFRVARHRALESVAVRVRHAGHDETAD